MYQIKSMNGLAKTLGKTVAKDAEYTYKQLRTYISVQNIKNIILNYAINKDGRYYISNDGVADSMSEIFDWLAGRELASLAAQDKIDCYWDDNKNEMVFNLERNNENDLA